MSNEKYLTSQEVASQLGVSVTTLLRWEKKGVLLPTMRTVGGARRYTQQQVDELKEKLKEQYMNDTEKTDTDKNE